MAVLASKTAGRLVVLALALSSLSGLVCADEDEKRTMKCCRADGPPCNTPRKEDDCCKPDRVTPNPAAVDSARSSDDVKPDLETAISAPAVTATDPGHRLVSVLSSRGSPTLLVHRPLDVPLLI
jgi:hypothetical protein